MSVRLYVCMSVRFRGNVIFSVPIYDRALIFCVHIPLVVEYLFYKYFVRRSIGQATKGKRASLLMDVVILVVMIFGVLLFYNLYVCIGVSLVRLRLAVHVFSNVVFPISL